MYESYSWWCGGKIITRLFGPFVVYDLIEAHCYCSVSVDSTGAGVCFVTKLQQSRRRARQRDAFEDKRTASVTWRIVIRIMVGNGQYVKIFYLLQAYILTAK